MKYLKLAWKAGFDKLDSNHFKYIYCLNLNVT